MIDPWGAFNAILVISNIAYVLPVIACIRYKRYFSAVIWLATMIHSIIYHSCKWGPYPEKGYGGYCITDSLNMDQFYLLDYFTTQMIIPLTVGFFINPKTAVRRHSFHDDYDYDKANDTLISFVFLSDGYYGKVPQVTKRWLCDLETIYIVYHVLVISTALKLVGPSVTKLTLPLLACNLLFVAMLLVQSIVANRIGNNVGITLGRDNDDNNNNRYQHFFYRNVLKVDYLKSMEWSIRVHENDGWYDLVKDKKLNLGIVTLFIIVNIILFSLQDIVIPPTVYWATHSLWHVFGPITAYILYAGVF